MTNPEKKINNKKYQTQGPASWAPLFAKVAGGGKREADGVRLAIEAGLKALGLSADPYTRTAPKPPKPPKADGKAKGKKADAAPTGDAAPAPAPAEAKAKAPKAKAPKEPKPPKEPKAKKAAKK